MTLEVEAKTKVRDDERQRAYREHLMHKREHYEQLRQYIELEDAIMRRLAQSRSELEDLQARIVFQKQYLSPAVRMPLRLLTWSYLDRQLVHASASVQVMRV